MWEAEIERELDVIIRVVLTQKEDMVIWKHLGIFFKTRECYNLMEGNDGKWEGNWKKIWKMKVPPKIHIFL